MTAITPDQRCTCAKPLHSGAFYCGRERCRGCDKLIVLSKAERLRLEALEYESLRRESLTWPVVHKNGGAA